MKRSIVPFIVAGSLLLLVVSLIVYSFNCNRYWVEYTTYYTDVNELQYVEKNHCTICALSDPTEADILDKAWSCVEHSGKLVDSLAINKVVK